MGSGIPDGAHYKRRGPTDAKAGSGWRAQRCSWHPRRGRVQRQNPVTQRESSTGKVVSDSRGIRANLGLG